MATCVNSYTGQPKVKHATKEAAYNHLDEVQRGTIHLYNVYKCYKCFHWHIGRRSVKWKRQVYDEILVGKLIGALKEVINK